VLFLNNEVYYTVPKMKCQTEIGICMCMLC